MLPLWFKQAFSSSQDKDKWRRHYVFFRKNHFSDGSIKLIFKRTQYNENIIASFKKNYILGLTGASAAEYRHVLMGMVKKKKYKFGPVKSYYALLRELGFNPIQLIRIFSFTGVATAVPALIQNIETLLNLEYNRNDLIRLIEKRRGKEKIRKVITHHLNLRKIGLSNQDIIRIIGAFGGLQSIDMLLTYHSVLSEIMVLDRRITWAQFGVWMQSGNGAEKIAILLENKQRIKTRCNQRRSCGKSTGVRKHQKFHQFMLKEYGIKAIDRKPSSVATSAAASASSSKKRNKTKHAAASASSSKKPNKRKHAVAYAPGSRMLKTREHASSSVRKYKQRKIANTSGSKMEHRRNRTVNRYAAPSQNPYSCKNPVRLFPKPAAAASSSVVGAAASLSSLSEARSVLFSREGAAANPNANANANTLKPLPLGISGLCRAAEFSKRLETDNPFLLSTYLSACQGSVIADKADVYLSRAMSLAERLKKIILLQRDKINAQQGIIDGQQKLIDQLENDAIVSALCKR